MAYRGDNRASRYLGHPAMQPGEYAAWLSERSAEWALDEPGHRRFYGIEITATGALVGDAVLIRSPDDGQGEMGMFLHPDTSGLGYSLEAGAALLDLAFRELRLHRVVGRADERNGGSVRAMERMGLRREGRFIESELRHGAWVTTVLYAILGSEWLSR